jgi:hypothetical protein
MFTTLTPVTLLSASEDVGKTVTKRVPNGFNWVVEFTIYSWLNRPKQAVLEKKNKTKIKTKLL